MTKKEIKPRSTASSSFSRQLKQEETCKIRLEKELSLQSFNSLSELDKKLKNDTLPVGISLIKEETRILFLAFSDHPQAHIQVSYCVEINEDMVPKVSAKGFLLSNAEISDLLIDGRLKTLTSLQSILSFLKAKSENDCSLSLKQAGERGINFVKDFASKILTSAEDEEVTRQLVFLIEQIELLFMKRKRYSNNILITAALWEMSSPSLYRQMKNDGLLSLPSVRHLQRLTKAFNTDTGFSSTSKNYLKTRISLLSEREKIVTLMLDEIYVAQRVEYGGGKLFGMDEGAPCKTLLAFMIKSIAGKYSDIVCLFPVINLDSKKIKAAFEKVFPALIEIGFHPIVISMDNASPNRRFLRDELCQKSLKESVTLAFSPEEVFPMFDTTHCFKNLFNNFVNHKVFKCPPFSTENDGFTASFSHIKLLYDMELGKPMKMAHRLNDKVLSPSALERTNVRLADSLFHDSTINALEFYLVQHPEFSGTIQFLKIIRHWWNIINVKTPNEGKVKRDIRRNPVTNENDEKLDYLRKFADWLSLWEESTVSKDKVCLTKETAMATKHTTLTLIAVAKFLLREKNFQYVLLGQIQSDPLEKRFSWYRQMSGGNYFVSVKQVLEAEKAIKMKSLLKFSGLSFEEAAFVIGNSDLSKEELLKVAEDILTCAELDTVFTGLEKMEDENILFYISGYFARSLSKSLSCEDCSSFVKQSRKLPALAFEDIEPDDEEKRKFIQQIDRGGVSFPTEKFYGISLLIWNTYSQIIKNYEAKSLLLSFPNPRNVFVEVMKLLFNQSDQARETINQHCNRGHLYVHIFEQLCGRMFNVFAKNLKQELNSEIHQGKKRAKFHTTGGRKAKKLSSQ